MNETEVYGSDAQQQLEILLDKVPCMLFGLHRAVKLFWNIESLA